MDIGKRQSRRMVFCVFYSLVSGAMASGQTVRPLIAELGNPAKGRVEYVNDTLTPLNVILEPKSFTVAEDGTIAYRPLDSTIRLRLSTTSFRIPPQQSYYVFYEANTESAPAWFVIYAAFSGFPFRTQQGMSVRLELPHTVYLLPKQSVAQSEVHVSHAEFHPDENRVRLEVENSGDHFGRILETFVTYSKRKQEAPGFPIFPHSRRIMEIPLEQAPEGENLPERVVLQFEKFKVEENLQRSGP